MHLRRFDNIQEFWQTAQAFLLRYQAENNVLLGVSHTLLHSPERYSEPPYLAIASLNHTPIAVAIQTPPYKLLLSKASDLAAIRLIAEDVQEQSQLPGVSGLEVEIGLFLQAWQALSERSYQRSIEMRIHQLTAVQPIAPTRGHLRLATEADRPLLIQWSTAFSAELEDVIITDDAERAVDGGLKRQTLYVWDDGEPVSLAAGRRSLPTAARIGFVYTPPQHRRKGYATACVAAVSQTMLDQGCERCFLLTDVANPTSNHIYYEIGYRPVCDWHEYRFD
jgi:hypothetical protein